MPIDIDNETLLSLTEATKVLPQVSGRRPAIATLWRWCRKGLHGVQLEYVRVGRNIATSRQALNRFFNALAASDIPLTQPSDIEDHSLKPTPRARDRMRKETDRILREAGIRQ